MRDSNSDPNAGGYTGGSNGTAAPAAPTSEGIPTLGTLPQGEWTGNAIDPQGQTSDYNPNSVGFGALIGVSDNPGQVYFGGDPWGNFRMTQQYQSLANKTMGQQAPTINKAGWNAQQANLNQSNANMGQAGAQMQGAGANSNAAVGQQNAALGYLANAAAGKGPSQAQMQLQQGVEQGINANMAMANSSRGQAGMANAQKNALTQNAGMQQNAALQSAQLRAQEMQQAQSQYMGAANQMQNQYAQQQLGFGQQQLGWGGQAQQGISGMNQFATNQAQLQEQQNALNQQGALGYQQLGFNAQAEALQAAEANQQMQQQTNMNNAKAVSGFVGGLTSALGGGMMSDERTKKGIHDGSKDIDSTLDAMGSHSFEYNDEELGPHRVGVMAQELARTPAGARMVRKEPQSGILMVDIPAATSFSLGALSHLHDRMNALEEHGGTRVGESQLREPGGGDSKWTLREEPDFIAAKNDRTGEVQKLATEPLSPEDARQVKTPHGAGPLSQHGDFDVGSMMGGMGGMMGGGSKGGDSGPQFQPVTNPNAAVSPAMMNAMSQYDQPQPYNPNTATMGAQQSGANQNAGTALAGLQKTYQSKLDSSVANGDYMSGGI